MIFTTAKHTNSYVLLIIVRIITLPLGNVSIFLLEMVKCKNFDN